MNRLFLITLFALAACAGTQQPGAAPPAAAYTPVATPLLDNDGTPLPPVPWAIPAEATHRTRSGLYATEAQARAHEHAQPGQVISVRVGCCGTQGVDDAMLSAWHQYVTLDAHADTPVLVRGPDPLQTAQVAERLGGAGFAPVFLVSVP